MAAENPFRVGGTVSGAYFTDRAAEIDRIEGALREPQAKLLVYGPRRLGKTSTITVASNGVRADGSPVVVADLSTASTVADMANRILQAASIEIGRTWRDVVADLVQNLRATVTLSADPATGMPTASLDVGLRSAAVEAQRDTLSEVLDVLERMAAEREVTMGVVLDEFQEISRFGGEAAEWHLRGVLQEHEHVGYVLAGSNVGLIRQMIDRNRAFYKLFELLRFGPIDPSHLAEWIDSRLEDAGVAPDGAGERVVACSGPRTRDVVQLARALFRTSRAAGAVRDGDVEAAFTEVVRAEGDALRIIWDGCTAKQQNVLRAVAAGAERLYAERTRTRFGLGPTASVKGAIDSLIKRSVLELAGERTRYDNPFMRGWVAIFGLADMGLTAPVLDADRWGG